MADPITAAPRMVQGYRDMAVPGAIYIETASMGKIDRLLFPDAISESAGNPLVLPTGQTLACGVFGGEGGLGADLERLVELLAGLDESTAGSLFASCLSVELVLSARMPMAMLNYCNPDTIHQNPHFRKVSYLPKQNTLGLPRGIDPAWNFIGAPASAPIVRKVMLGIDLFAVLGSLWADTQSHRASKNETAASLPGDTAAVSDQTKRPDMVGEHRQAKRERESLQASDSQAGHSSPKKRKKTDASRHGDANHTTA